MVMHEGEIRPEMFSFEQDARVVAEQLRGATIIYGEEGLRRAVIVEARGYPADQIIDDFFQPAQDQPIGAFTRTDYLMRGQRVFSPNITVAGRGLVMPIDLEVPGKRIGTTRHITSQSAITREFGLEEGVSRRLEVIDPVGKVFRLV